MSPTTARATTATGTSERSSARSPSRAPSSRRRSAAICCRISAVPRSGISAHGRERQRCLLDCLRRLRRRSLPCRAQGEEAKSRSQEADHACDDEEREPERKGFGEPCCCGRECEADSVEDERRSACTETAGNRKRSRLLFLLELRQFEIQCCEQPKLPLHSVQLREHTKHRKDVLPQLFRSFHSGA